MVGVIEGEVPRVTTDTSTITSGSLFSTVWPFSAGDCSFSFDFSLDDDPELDGVSSLASRLLVFLTDASLAFIYESAELLVREPIELLLPP